MLHWVYFILSSGMILGCNTTQSRVQEEGEYLPVIPALPQESSFNDLWQKVSQFPLNAESFPEPPGITRAQLFGHLFFNEGVLVGRSHRTLVDEIDEKENDVKWLHPKGVCAPATWSITEPNPATGLFAQGTEVPAIIRFSSGTIDSVYDPAGRGRIFGLAIKLFPHTDPDQPVRTTNIVTLDNYGFERDVRHSFFHPDDDSHQAVFFTNVMPARSALGNILSQFFERFDSPNFSRPVYATAMINQNGQMVADPTSPIELWFSPSHEPLTPPTDDFREEIINHQAGDIRFNISIVVRDHHDVPRARTVGSLNVGQPLVSEYCDKTLHFHHHPNENQVQRHNSGQVERNYQGRYLHIWPPEF